ncbi:MAG TPA: hypothetical protein VKG82_04700 [Solirubrobacteraceae bacterium]|nr:hypothetical protein [Solirubrobacteraceae bacterium]
MAAYHSTAKHDRPERDGMTASGAAMRDGRHPTTDEDDLPKAIHAVGRGHQTVRDRPDSIEAEVVQKLYGDAVSRGLARRTRAVSQLHS